MTANPLDERCTASAGSVRGSGAAATHFTVLAIDDDAGDAELLRRVLEKLPGWELEFLHAPSFDAAQPHLARPDVDLIFLDYLLGRESGENVLSVIRSTGDIRPIVVITGHGNEQTAVALMRAGADDYLIKGAFDASTMRRAIDNARAQHARRKFETKNRQLLEDLQIVKTKLEMQNRRLAGLYESAHHFVDHVSHEFRTPLTVIREFASIMRDGLAGAVCPEQNEYLDIIVNRVDDLSALVADMLDISKLEAGMLGISRCDCRVGEIIERIRSTLERRAATSNCQLDVNLPSDLPLVFCDPEKVGRVIVNLVNNALRFSPERGVVTLRACARPEQHEIVVAVADRGPGIAPEACRELFQRFRQVAGRVKQGVKGFGLGLSIVKELVQLNLGDVTVESEVGSGSVFSFTLPCAERRELLRRFLARAHGFRAEARVLVLLEVVADAHAQPSCLDELEQLLQHVARRSDLLLRIEPHRWVYCCPAVDPDLSALILRIEHARDEANRNRVAGPLPAITLDYVGSWDVQDESDSLIERFEALAAGRELTRA